MEPILLRASEESKNQRLDAFLASSLDGLTRSQATRLIESGEVAVDGKSVSKSYKLAGGEDVAVTLPEPEPVEAVPQDIPLDVVYEDADVIVVNKPSGMVVHPAPGHPDGTLVNALLYHCAGTLSGIGGALRPGIVHRIDRDTSGLIIALAPQVRPLLKKGGLFLCSGIIDDRAVEVADALRLAGWAIMEARESEGWFSYLCK